MDEVPTNSEEPKEEKQKVPQTMDEIREWRAQQESGERGKQEEREQKIQQAYGNMEARKALAGQQEQLRDAMNKAQPEGNVPETQRQRDLQAAFDQTESTFRKLNAESESLQRELGYSEDQLLGMNIPKKKGVGF